MEERNMDRVSDGLADLEAGVPLSSPARNERIDKCRKRSPFLCAARLREPIELDQDLDAAASPGTEKPCSTSHAA